MKGKFLYLLLAVLSIGFFATAIVLKQPEPERPGTAQKDLKGNHVDKKEYGGDEPPTSGDHASPVAWGVYKKELADVNTLHNLEHGGIYVTYSPDIPEEDIQKLEKLFSTPSSRKEFNPAKAVVAPRGSNVDNIVLSSWNRSQTFTSYDEEKMYEYYVANFNKSPEPLAK